MMIKFIALILLSVFSGFLVTNFVFKENTAYVDIESIYESYPLKKELEEKLETDQSQRDKIIDSLQNDLKLVAYQLQEESSDKKLLAEYKLKREQLEIKQHNLTEEANLQVEEFKNQIWKQIRQYIKEYGDSKGLDYIFSSDNSYYLLYHNDSKNITEELKKFLENKYYGN